MPDREKVIKDLEECLSASCRGFRPRLSCPYNDEEWDIMRDALAMLKEQEVKTGHWIDTTKVIGFPRVQCSVCGSGQGAIWMDYCPICGAKMEGR